MNVFEELKELTIDEIHAYVEFCGPNFDMKLFNALPEIVANNVSIFILKIKELF